MSIKIRKETMIRTVLAVILATLPALAMARDTAESQYGAEWDDPKNFSDEYKSGNYGRVLSADQGGRVIHENPDPTEPPEENLTRNAPVFPGDRILTEAYQRISVELAGGSLVRLDDGTELLFQALPDPYAGYRDNTTLNLIAGSLQIRTSNLEEDTFRVDTPSASVYLLGDGEFRIDLLSSGETVVRSWRGVAELSGDGGSVLIRSGMESAAYAGAYPSDPSSFNTVATDRFDRWVQSRDEALRARAGAGRNHDYDDEAVYESLPSEVRPYYRELSGSGSWTYANDYGWVWYPSEVQDGWRPYLGGYWAYGPGGYFWVSNENWGWAPYHYGRWDRLAGYGWCWIPGRVFGGAWVSWSWGSTYVGWAPLNYWNRPVYYGSLYGDWYYGGSWNFIRYNHFRHRNYYHHRVAVGHVYRTGHRGAIVTRPPKVSPRELTADGGSRARAIRLAKSNALDRRTGGVRSRDGEKPNKATVRKFRETESRIMNNDRRKTVNTRPSFQSDRDNPARTSSPTAKPRPTRAHSEERKAIRRPTTRPQREKPVYRKTSDDSGDRVREMYRGVSKQSDRPSRATTPSRTVRPSTPSARPAPSRSTTPQRKAAPSRSTAPQRKAAPSRSTAPQRKAAPSRSTAPQRKAAPSRSTAPQRKAAPKKSSTSKSSSSRSRPSKSRDSSKKKK